MKKFLRDLTKIAEEEGFEYKGYAGSQSGGSGSGHYVFTDTKSDAVVRTSSTPKSEGNTLKNARGNFRKTRVATDSKAGAFKRWILKRYKVGRSGSKVVTIQLSELVAEYNAQADSEHQINAAHVTVMIGQDAMFERLSFKRGGGQVPTTTMRIMGPLYGVEKDADEPITSLNVEVVCGSTFKLATGGVAVCVKEHGHEGLHWDSFRNVRWAEGSGVKFEQPVTPVIDPVAQQAIHALPKLAEQVTTGPTMTPAPAVLEPVTVNGVELPATLADQLREALGVPSAAIAADAHDAALRALEDAQNALQLAIDALHGVPVVKNKQKTKSGWKDGGFGKKGRERINTILAAVGKGELPSRFTISDVVARFGYTEGEATSLLAKANRIGDTFRRVAPNTYEVR